MAHVATVAPLTDASVPELKPLSSSDELAVEPQDVEEADGLLLHLIRTIALYLFVLLSQTAKLAVADAELVGFVSDAATPDLLDAQTAALQRRLHLALFAWVQGEVNSNQFDGLLQEQRAFVVIKRLFRQQHTKAAAQCRVLAALLTSYLARLETPLVQCEPSSMLSSTLEYLLAKEANSASKEPVPLPMLYPLVNAVDLVSIEQRECLDALMNLLRWLTAHDETKTVLTSFASKYHVKIIGKADCGDRIGSDADSDSDALGVCFVQMLLRYSDHIFRRDLQFENMVPTLSFSDTEDDDVCSEDGSTLPRQRSLSDSNDIPDSSPALNFEKLSNPASATREAEDKEAATLLVLPEPTPSYHAEDVLGSSIAVMSKDKTQTPRKVSSRTLRKRKKREEKLVLAGTKTTRRSNKSRSKPIRSADFEDEELLMVMQDEEPLPAVVCVGIAAAAGTLAAVLCAFFN